jgi:PTS system nitrogen regulatory IIA component
MDVVRLPAIGAFLARKVDPATGHGWPGGKKRPMRSTIADLLVPKDILLDIIVASKGELIDEIGQRMEWVHGIARESVALSLSDREEIGSTALGQGVAIPHARVKGLDRIQVIYIRLKLPIFFDAPDGKPVSDIFVLLVPKQATEEHLNILAEASQMFCDRHFREQLHICKHPQEVKRLFDAWPESSA